MEEPMVSTTSASPQNSNPRAGDGASDAIAVSTFRNRTDVMPVRVAARWPGVVKLLTTHRVSAQKDGPMFSPATFREGTTRANENVEKLSLLVHEFDHDVDIEAIRCAVEGLDAVVYSTWSSRPDVPRVRVVIHLSRPIVAAEQADLWERAQQHLYHGKADEAAKALSQAFYLPSCPPEPDYERIAIVNRGRPLDPDELPAREAGFSNRNGHAAELPQLIGDHRNVWLTSLGGSIRRRGMTEEETAGALLIVNDSRCSPPLGEREVRGIARSLARYEPDVGEFVSSAQNPRATDANETLSGLFRTARQVAEATPADTQWIAPGVAACGAITELSGAIKTAGKTTFVLALTAAVVKGGAFLGRRVQRAAVVYLTEQSPHRSAKPWPAPSCSMPTSCTSSRGGTP
jgi:hypothetical protein